MTDRNSHGYRMKHSSEYREAYNAITDGLKDKLAEISVDYFRASLNHLEQGRVNYKILSDLLYAGWNKASGLNEKEDEIAALKTQLEELRLLYSELQTEYDNLCWEHDR